MTNQKKKKIEIRIQSFEKAPSTKSLNITYRAKKDGIYILTLPSLALPSISYIFQFWKLESAMENPVYKILYKTVAISKS